MNVYAGYLKNKAKIMSSASGGAVTAIMESFIKDGGYVCGVKYTKDYYGAVYSCVSNIEEINEFKGSKYFKKDTSLIKEEIQKKLTEGKKILFIGLGCDISGLKSFLEYRETSISNLYTIELICDGVTKSSVHEQYIKELEMRYHSKISYFTTRYKNDGWETLRIYAEFKNGKMHQEDFYCSAYGYAFANYKEKMCYFCKHKGCNHPGDIVVGDYWGCLPGMATYCQYGVSLIIPNNKTGSELLKMIDKESFYLKEIEKEYALYNNPRFLSCHEQNRQWDEFDKLFLDKGLISAFDSMGSKNKKKTDFEVAFQIIDSFCLIYGEHKRIDKYFEVNGINSVAIYGAGKIGMHLYRLLKNTKVKIDYMIDRNADKIDHEGIRVLGLQSSYPKVDMVIVAVANHYMDIVNSISLSLKDTLIISVEEYVEFTISNFENVMTNHWESL